MSNGFIVRSGAAGGADATVNEAYLLCDADVVTEPEVYVPWKGFGEDIRNGITYSIQGNNNAARTIAQSIHPAWDKCSIGTRSLHTRNVCQILGSDLNTPSTVVLYWCPERGGKPTGGTATAVNLARKYGIKTVNMLHSDWSNQLREALGMNTI